MPAGTPNAIIDRLNGAMNTALSKPKTRDRLLETATEPVGGDAHTMSRLWREDFEKYGKLVKELNISSIAQ